MPGSLCTSKRYTGQTITTSPNPVSKDSPGHCGQRLASIRTRPMRSLQPRARWAADFAQGTRMAVYPVHQPPLRADDAAADPDRFIFVRDGFYGWALLFGPLWMLRHRLWL